MKTLVFGAGGYIGRHLVSHLRTFHDMEVVEASTQDGQSIDGITGCIGSGFELPADIDTVFYLSQSPYWREGAARFDHVLAVNCGAPVRLAAMAQKAGVQRFLFASTGTVYQPSPSGLTESAPINRQDWYSMSKLFAEEALLNLGGSMTVSCLRFFGVYGPKQQGRLVSNLAKRIAADLPVTLDVDVHTGLADGLRSTMTHVNDLVVVLSQLGKSETLPPILNVASDQAASIREIAFEVSHILRKPVKFEETGRLLNGHFVADVSKMRSLVQHSFLSFSEGLAAIRSPADLGIA